MTGFEIMYAAMAGIGAVFLILSLIGLDGEVDIEIGEADFDISDAEVGVDSPGYFSMKTMATFLVCFGVAAYVTTFKGMGIPMQLVNGFLAGLVVSFLYFLVMKGMYAMQGDSSVSGATMLGKTAIVTTPTVGSGIAQVKFTSGGLNEEYTAREMNNVKLKINETVKVVSSNGGVLMVVKQKITNNFN